MSAAPPPPPPLPEGDLAHLAIKVPTHLDELEGDWFQVDFKKGTSADVDHLDWSKSVGFTASEGGAEGVLFVQFEDNSITAVKASSTITADMFAYDLANLSGLAVPQTRILRFGLDPDFDVIHAKLNELDSKNSPLERGRHEKFEGRPLFALMEFIPGRGLHDLQAKEVFGKGKLSVKGMHNCRTIAKFTVFDMVINNWDRIPLIWDNEGNPENILCCRRKKDPELLPVAIDNTITCIDPAVVHDNFDEYMDKVRFIVNELCAKFNEPPCFKDVRKDFVLTGKKVPSLNHINEFFHAVLNYDIGPDGMVWVATGLLEQMKRYAELSRADLQAVKDAIEKFVSPALDLVATNLDGVGFTKINIDFVDSVIEVFRKASPTISKLLEIAKKQADEAAAKVSA